MPRATITGTPGSTSQVDEISLNVAAGDTIWLDGIRLDVVWPVPGSVPARPPDSGKEINDTSVVLELHFGARDMLFQGDAEEGVDPLLLAEEIERLLPGPLLPALVARHLRMVAVGQEHRHQRDGNQRKGREQRHVVVEIEAADHGQREHDTEADPEQRWQHENVPVLERAGQFGDAAASPDAFEQPAVESCAGGPSPARGRGEAIHCDQGMGTCLISSAICSSGVALKPALAMSRCRARPAYVVWKSPIARRFFTTVICAGPSGRGLVETKRRSWPPSTARPVQAHQQRRPGPQRPDAARPKGHPAP